MNEFTEWFESQCGRRPSNKPIDDLMADRNSKLSVADTASRLVDACELYDEKKAAALSLWVYVVAMQGEIERSRETLQSIVDADWRRWKELATPDEFVRWAKSRALHALKRLAKDGK